MPQRCTVCDHPHRGEIDLALVGDRAAKRRIASQHGLTERAVRNHKANHLHQTLAKSQDAQEVAQADDLLRQMRALQAKTLSILLRADRTGDLRTALAAIREARGNLELLASLVGELDERPEVNILLSTDWSATRTALMEALAPFP